MAFHLINGLNKVTGVDLFVMLSIQEDSPKELQGKGIPVYVIEEGKHSFPAIVKIAAATVRKQAPHIIHSHRYKENILSYLVTIALKERAALVSTQHGLPETYNSRLSLMNRLKAKFNYGLLASVSIEWWLYPKMLRMLWFMIMACERSVFMLYIMGLSSLTVH
ncbi:MAG: hypothetical protein MZV65_20835 [Chromatiales bacterium]|nr:hypothetical protein [Chromatiales bacterium]